MTVNEVRALLGLPPATPGDLAAIRTILQQLALELERVTADKVLTARVYSHGPAGSLWQLYDGTREVARSRYYPDETTAAEAARLYLGGLVAGVDLVVGHHKERIR